MLRNTYPPSRKYLPRVFKLHGPEQMTSSEKVWCQQVEHRHVPSHPEHMGWFLLLETQIQTWTLIGSGGKSHDM